MVEVKLLQLAHYCIFLDVNMPGKNGLDCLADIRNNPKLKNVPVIIYSALDNDKTVDTAYTYGANIFLNKTGDYHLLLDKVNKILDDNNGLLKNRWDKKQFEIKE